MALYGRERCVLGHPARRAARPSGAAAVEDIGDHRPGDRCDLAVQRPLLGGKGPGPAAGRRTAGLSQRCTDRRQDAGDLVGAICSGEAEYNEKVRAIEQIIRHFTEVAADLNEPPSARAEGVSIRTLAAAAGLSPARVDQITGLTDTHSHSPPGVVHGCEGDPLDHGGLSGIGGCKSRGGGRGGTCRGGQSGPAAGRAVWPRDLRVPFPKRARARHVRTRAGRTRLRLSRPIHPARFSERSRLVGIWIMVSDTSNPLPVGHSGKADN